MLSSNDGIRCLPLSSQYNPNQLRTTLPSIQTTRQRLDTQHNRKWNSDPSNRKLRRKTRKKSKAEAFEVARKNAESKNALEKFIK